LIAAHAVADESADNTGPAARVLDHIRIAWYGIR
jgi:hypothetical protein